MSEGAVFRRVKDALRREGISLKACPRNAIGRVELGRYYTVQDNTGRIDSTHVDLEAWARDMELLDIREGMVPEGCRRIAGS